MNRITSVGVAVLGLSLAVAGYFAASDPFLRDLWIGAGAVGFAMGASLFASTFWMRMPEQDLFDALREERRTSDSPVSLSFSITPLPSGVGAAIAGQF